ncbi:glycosyltransferase family 4 protein [bacterium]|nr:glycosyltransferase family 4 protein [bacterium]
MKQLLILSHMFPNRNDPRLGIFVHDQLISLQDRYAIHVLSPTPWFPDIPFFRRWSRHRRVEKTAVLNGLTVDYPRRLVFPKGYGQVFMGLFYFFTAYRRCKNLSFDLIHSHAVWPDGFAASLIGRRLHKPVIITSHGADTYRFLNNITTRPLVRWGLRHAQRVIAVSLAEKRFLQGQCGIEEKLLLINNGVNLEKFYPQPMNECRQRLHLVLDKKIILYVGYLYPVKGVTYLLDAFSRLRRLRPDLHLVLVGGGSESGALTAQASRLGISADVTFSGEKPHDEIPLWMNAADLFCLPSLNEGWPTVLFEALACAKPIVATRVGGIPEAIGDERYAILVEPAQPQALGEALDRALQKTWSPSALTDYARANSWQAKADELSIIYESLIA